MPQSPLPDWRPESFVATDGAQLTVWRHPERHAGRPHLHFAHATGLSGLSYRDLLEPLASRVNLWAWDMRGHGLSESGTAGSPLQSWDVYYRDLQTLMDHIGEPLILAGHSVGGMSCAAAASRQPAQVLGLLLIDPVVICGLPNWALRLAALAGRPHPLATLSAKRRECFASRDAILSSFRGRAIFRDWSEAALQDYVDSAFEPSDDGWHLRCSPAFESRSFALTELSPFTHLHDLSMPGRVLVAEHDSTMSPAGQRRWRRQFSQITIRQQPGSTHMLPFEYPDVVRAMAIELLDGLN